MIRIKFKAEIISIHQRHIDGGNAGRKSAADKFSGAIDCGQGLRKNAKFEPSTIICLTLLLPDRRHAVLSRKLNATDNKGAVRNIRSSNAFGVYIRVTDVLLWAISEDIRRGACYLYVVDVSGAWSGVKFALYIQTDRGIRAFVGDDEFTGAEGGLSDSGVRRRRQRTTFVMVSGRENISIVIVEINRNDRVGIDDLKTRTCAIARRLRAFESVDRNPATVPRDCFAIQLPKYICAHFIDKCLRRGIECVLRVTARRILYWHGRYIPAVPKLFLFRAIGTLALVDENPGRHLITKGNCAGDV